MKKKERRSPQKDHWSLRKGRWSRKKGLAWIAAAAVLAAVSLCAGRYPVTGRQLYQAVFDRAALAAENPQAAVILRVVFQIRLPRILFALAAGAGLAAAGSAMQAVCANPLATPDTVGVANGASFGAAFAILAGMDGLGIQLTAMAAGMAAFGLAAAIGSRGTGNPVLRLVLSGMVVSSLFAALLSLVKYVADPQDKLPEITHWLMGSLNTVIWQNVRTGIGWIAAGSGLIWLLRWKLNALMLSEEEARSLGVHTAIVRVLAAAAAAAATSAVVAACGQIGWIGLLIPHVCRMRYGNDCRQTVPAGMCAGAVFLLLIDTAARSIAAAEIPAAILTAAVGAPLFLFCLQKSGLDGRA